MAESDAAQLYPFLGMGLGMIAVAVASAVFWRRRSGAGWRWFWIGAGLWTLGVAGKVAWSLLANQSLFEAMIQRLPQGAFVAAGSVYLGVVSASWEIGVTLLAGLYWRGMTQTAGRAAGVGVGAGAFEAALLGLPVLIGVSIAILGGAYSEQITKALVGGSEMTSVAWLVGPVERLIAILCHTSSRMLVLLAVAKRRWWPFWCGFLLFAVLDGIAGSAHLAGLIGKINMWWVELAILPMAIVSVPIIRACIRHWPEVEADDSSAD